MREMTRPGQVWCWGSRDHERTAERLWLITALSRNCGDSLDILDGLAVDLEDGVEKPVFNVPAQSHDESSAFLDTSHVAWRRVL